MRPTLHSAIVASASLVICLAAAAPPAPPPCTLVWGPNYECLLHGEFAKEGLFVDASQRSFSVGYSDVASGPTKDALLFVRDGAGNVLSNNFWSVPGFDNIAAGLWGEPTGASIVTTGAVLTGVPSNPRNMVLSRWLPGPGTPWTTPVLAATNVLTPTALGLLGDRTFGCRVVKAPGNDLFVSGCTNQELFVLRIDRTTLQPVTSWGTNGVQSVASFDPNGCPVHPWPGAFIDFNIYPQAFVEVVGARTYLGGTLARTIPGTTIGIDQDFVVDAFDTATGTPIWGLGGQFSSGTGDEYMKAMAATPTGVYATGANTTTGELELIGWRTDGVMRAPGIVTYLSPSRGNDVEAVTAGNQTHMVVGGYGNTGSSNTGATWHFRHGPGLAAPIVLLTQWSSNTSGGANPKIYGPNAAVTDEVYDVAIGRGPFAGYVFATGRAFHGPFQHSQPLQCIALTGATQFSTPQSPYSDFEDRGTAVVFHPSTAVFTHGTADDLNGQWSCPAHWVSRSTRYQP
jgi:hypothetical protein